MQKYEAPLGWAAIGRVVTVILITLFVWKTYPILFLILLSVIFAVAFYPLVAKMDRFLPRSLATLLVVMLLILPFIIFVISLIPSFSKEIPQLLNTLERVVENSSFIPPAVRNLDFSQYGQNFVNYLFQSTALVTGIFGSVLTLLFLTFFMIIEADSLLKMFVSVFPKKRQEHITVALTELGKVNGQYIRGTLLKAFICGITSYIALVLLGIPFAAPLAIFVAILDLLPLIGPTIGMIPAIIIAVSVSPISALSVTVFFLIYQQFESGFLAPKIYNKTMNISPALGFIAVIIGAQLYGVLGAFLALPVAASIPVCIQYYRDQRDSESSK